jgi:hypothetical protein
VASSCYPLIENGTNLLNPCGLIANSLFNGDYFCLGIQRIFFTFIVDDFLYRKSNSKKMLLRHNFSCKLLIVISNTLCSTALFVSSSFLIFTPSRCDHPRVFSEGNIDG